MSYLKTIVKLVYQVWKSKRKLGRHALSHHQEWSFTLSTNWASLSVCFKRSLNFVPSKTYYIFNQTYYLIYGAFIILIKNFTTCNFDIQNLFKFNRIKIKLNRYEFFKLIIYNRTESKVILSLYQIDFYLKIDPTTLRTPLLRSTIC